MKADSTARDRVWFRSAVPGSVWDQRVFAELMSARTSAVCRKRKNVTDASFFYPEHLAFCKLHGGRDSFFTHGFTGVLPAEVFPDLPVADGIHLVGRQGTGCGSGACLESVCVCRTDERENISGVLCCAGNGKT